MNSNKLARHKNVQEIARDTMKFLESFIEEGIAEKEIAAAAEKYMKERGINSFWYHGVGAFVFVRERTALSISGREYAPSQAKVEADDLVTVDLSPEIDGFWGDFARTFVVSKGKVVGTESEELGGSPAEFIEGVKTEEILHREFQKMISEGMAFEEAYQRINSLINELDYENLDFKKNLGHSIEKKKDNRIYIEAGSKKIFKDINLFTFEPHIRKKGGKYGFKREDIYYFKNGKINIL
ncbi:MAG: M24 family metallopeptidase [Parcubacteria group bacterium]|jgi:methionine aminopeptidase